MTKKYTPDYDFEKSSSYKSKPKHVPKKYQPFEPILVWSIVGFIFSVLFWPLGLILSIIAVRMAKKHKKRGFGLAIAGIVVASIQLIFWSIILYTVVNSYGSL